MTKAERVGEVAHVVVARAVSATTATPPGRIILENQFTTEDTVITEKKPGVTK